MCRQVDQIMILKTSRKGNVKTHNINIQISKLLYEVSTPFFQRLTTAFEIH